MTCLTHLFSSFRTLGGVESVLKHHYAHDIQANIDARFVIYFEPEQEPIQRVSFLGLRSDNSIRDAQRALARAMANFAPEVVLYHGMWGMPYLAPLDRAPRRILMLHGTTPSIMPELTRRAGWVDGVLGVSEPLRQIVRQCAPHLGTDRIQILPYPIEPPPNLPTRAPLAGRPLTLGFCGRLTVEQKRIDRLPRLFAQLDSQGLDYRCEFLGDGSDRLWLQNQLTDRVRFTFHGRQSGHDYWRILAGWDVILFTSDYEGTPIALLEALSAGVIPIYPLIQSGGETYAQRILPELVYPPDDFQHLARTLSQIRGWPETNLAALRELCRAAVRDHLGDTYLRQFAEFVHRIRSLPQIARHDFPTFPFPLDRLSFRNLERISRLRSFFGAQPPKN